MIPKFKAALFDMDGTLLCTMRYWRFTTLEVLLAHDIIPTAEQLSQMYSTSSRRLCMQILAERGLELCFHPHAMTYVFNRESIDYFVANTDPKYVKLCIDTAHTTLAGIDPVELCRTYGKRVGYMHLKDVDPSHDIASDPGRGKMGAFRALGLGTVDFKGVVKALKENGYDGVLCVELDNPEICNFRSAQISRQYIKDVLKL